MKNKITKLIFLVISLSTSAVFADDNVGNGDVKGKFTVIVHNLGTNVETLTIKLEESKLHFRVPPNPYAGKNAKVLGDGFQQNVIIFQAAEDQSLEYWTESSTNRVGLGKTPKEYFVVIQLNDKIKGHAYHKNGFNLKTACNLFDLYGLNGSNDSEKRFGERP